MTTSVQCECSPIYGNRSNVSMVDFPGRMAAVFFTSGCNFRCGFCHNASLLGTPRAGYTWGRLGELCERFRRQWARGVVITGGEPTISPSLPAAVEFFREQGFAVKLDTNGSRPDVLATVLPRLAYVAMDVKCGLARYPSFVKFPHADRIAESIGLIRRSGIPYEFRTTVVESVHDEAEVRAVGEAVRGASRHVLQPFVPRDDLPDASLRVAPRTHPSRLRQAADILAEHVDEVDIRGE